MKPDIDTDWLRDSGIIKEINEQVLYGRGLALFTRERAFCINCGRPRAEGIVCSGRDCNESKVFSQKYLVVTETGEFGA